MSLIDLYVTKLRIFFLCMKTYVYWSIFALQMALIFSTWDTRGTDLFLLRASSSVFGMLVVDQWFLTNMQPVHPSYLHPLWSVNKFVKIKLKYYVLFICVNIGQLLGRRQMARIWILFRLWRQVIGQKRSLIELSFLVSVSILLNYLKNISPYFFLKHSFFFSVNSCRGISQYIFFSFLSSDV